MSDIEEKRYVSQGKCYFCNSIFAKSGMSRHLKSCKQRKEAPEQPQKGKLRQTKLFQIQAEGKYNSEYWMHVEIPADQTLDKLDQFLRNIWLECCGHLSAFTIGDQEYDIDGDDGFGWGGQTDMRTQPLKQVAGVDVPDGFFDNMFRSAPKSMRSAVLGKILKPGMKFRHEYDFGTTTDLTLKVIGEREAQIAKNFGVQILARNEPPPIKCEFCDNLATQVCTECIWDNAGWVCDDHASEHNEDMLLPVVNSPRVGMCGYTG